MTTFLRCLGLSMCIAAAPAAGAAGPQSPTEPAASGRSKAIGVVTTEHGRHVAGAQVTLWSWPVPARTDIGTVDRVVVTTDDDGRFFAGIWDGRCYGAFATWRDELGTHATAIEPAVIPGSPRTLREVEPRVRGTVCVRGATRWFADGQLQVHAVVGIDNPFVVPLALDRERDAVLPESLPAGPTSIDVRTKTGRLLATAPLADDPSATTHTIELPGAHVVALRVLDAADRPVPGAVVHQINDFGCCAAPGCRRGFAPDVIGATSASGTLRIELPAVHPVDRAARDRLLLLVSALDHERCVIDVPLSGSDEGVPATAVLRPGTTLRGKFVDADGAAVNEGIVALVESFAHTEARNLMGGTVVAMPPMPMPIAADGSFVAPGPYQGEAVRVFAVLGPVRGRALGLETKPGFGLPALVPVLLESGAPRGDLDLGEVRLDRLHVARFAVTDHTGAPASGVRARLASPAAFCAPDDFLADRIGRLQVPLPEGVHRISAFVPGGGVASAVVRVPLDTLGDRRIELRLTEPLVVSGVVAAAGADLAPGTEVVVCDVRANDPDLTVLAPRAVAVGRPAPDGSFSVRVPFGDARYTLRARCRAGQAAPGLWPIGPEVAVQVHESDVTGLSVPGPVQSK
ncbi:MAG TPA: hypothetical protein VFZ65_21155 [Planctomycetota bacterium]|nr:hypothetical protein [Planctomycetota bacterium]